MISHPCAAFITCIYLLLGGIPPAPPVAQQVPHMVESSAGSRMDEYYWLRDDGKEKRPEIIQYLTDENKYTEAMTEGLKPLQATLLAEMRGRIKEDDFQPPSFQDGYWYWTRFEFGAEYAVYMRLAGSAAQYPSEGAPAPQVLLDGPALAKGKPFFSVGALAVSPNNRILAWTDDHTGRRINTLRFKDLETGSTLADEIPGVLESMAWAADSRTIFYIRQDPVLLQSGPVYRHILGTRASEDQLVYEEPDLTLIVDVSLSASRERVVILSDGFDFTEIRAVDAAKPESEPCLVWGRAPGVRTYADHLHGKWVMRTNKDARNFRLVEADDGNSANAAKWRELVPSRVATCLEDVALFASAIAVQERGDANCSVRVLPWSSAASAASGGVAETGVALVGVDEMSAPFTIPAAESAYTMTLGENADPSSPWVRVHYTSMVTPHTVMDVDLASGASQTRKVQPVIGYQPGLYATNRIWAPARDGKRIPISIAWRRDAWKQDGTAPVYQEGYGAYGLSFDAEFSSNQVSLLDRGFLVATAHIRGGADLGQDWYEDGRLMHKQNTFNDFEDVTDWLVREKYAAGDKVFASGGSAGGLLMGAIANQAGSKYRAIGLHVPFVDALTTMLDETIPLTTNEWSQWGDPRQAAAYEYIRSYSPYDNIAARQYPAMLVTAGLWDSQVQYFEPAKYVARLRAMKTDSNPLLLRVNMDAGHGGNSGRFERLKEIALEYAFFIDLLLPRTRRLCAKACAQDGAPGPVAAGGRRLSAGCNRRATPMAGTLPIGCGVIDRLGVCRTDPRGWTHLS